MKRQVVSAPVSPPWTQSLNLSWGPELQFYEQRVALLRRLQDDGVLRAFRMHESHIDARLFNARHELSVRHDGLTLDVATQDDVAEALEVVQLAFDVIRPSSQISIGTGSQFVVEVDGTFEEALARAHKAFFTDLNFSGLRHPDFALLVDIHMPGPPTADGAAEFGIVRDHEIRERVGIASRRRAGSRSTNFDFSDVAVPAVAIFVDAGLTFERLEPDEAQDGLLMFLQQTDDMLGTFVSRIEQRFVEAEATDDGSGGDE